VCSCRFVSDLNWRQTRDHSGWPSNKGSSNPCVNNRKQNIFSFEVKESCKLNCENMCDCENCDCENFKISRFIFQLGRSSQRIENPIQNFSTNQRLPMKFSIFLNVTFWLVVSLVTSDWSEQKKCFIPLGCPSRQ